MSIQFIGEIRVMGFNWAPLGWALCNGQLLPINQNQALFGLLGNTYGGDGRSNFALPNLQGRTWMHQGPGFPPGKAGGEQAHMLVLGEMPLHNHLVTADSVQAAPDGQNPAPNRVLAASTGTNLYGPAGALAPLDSRAVGLTGGGQPHDNMSPYTVLNVCIALTGIYPSPN